MNEEGIDISNNIRKQVTREMADEVDHIILVIDEMDPVPDYLKGNKKVTTWLVADPKGQNLDFHRKVRGDIKSRIADLITDIQS